MVDVQIPKSAPIWIRLRNIPFHLCSKNIPLALASAIGTPIRVDYITVSHRLLSFVRLRVEVDLSKELPSSVWMDVEGNSPINILVDYENLPCSFCLKFGHRASHCPEGPGKSASSSSPSKFSSPILNEEPGILGPSPLSCEPALVSSPARPTSPPSCSPQEPHLLNPFDLLEACSMKIPLAHSSPNIPFPPDPMGDINALATSTSINSTLIDPLVHSVADASPHVLRPHPSTVFDLGSLAVVLNASPADHLLHSIPSFLHFQIQEVQKEKKSFSPCETQHSLILWPLFHFPSQCLKFFFGIVGTCQPSTKRYLRHLLVFHNPNFLFIAEPRSPAPQLRQIFSSLSL